jgi:3-methyladenine DNA glycosylase/8-oxoguanine DNA glycosylase
VVGFLFGRKNKREEYMPIFEYGERELNHLQRRDKVLGSAILKIGMINRDVTPDLFTALVKSILGQQISSAAAKTVWGRLLTGIGKLTPASVYETPLDTLRQYGMSARKADYIKGIAAAVLKNDLDLSGLHRMTDQEVIKHLTELKGIGVWTAEMLLIFGLQRPDVVSWGDQGIRRGMMKLYCLEDLDREQFEVYRERYSPYGTVASLYLWELAAPK